jgi:hypothetical protein
MLLHFHHSTHPDARNHQVSSFAPKTCKTPLFKSGKLAEAMSKVFFCLRAGLSFTENESVVQKVFDLHFYDLPNE